MKSGAKESDPDLVVRPLTPADVAEVARMEAEIFSDPWSETAFNEILTENGWSAIAAESGGRIIGYACYVTIPPEVHLTNIAVDAVYRRKSVAKRLLEHILKDVKTGECECVILEVRSGNTAARAFYEKHGFRFLYRRPNYYRRPVEDAHVLVYYFEGREDGN